MCLRLITTLTLVASLTVAAPLCSADQSSAPAADSAKSNLLGRKIPNNKNIIIFDNSKGEVVFNHAIHSRKLKESDCILCHRTDKPTKEKILTRFDDHRIAHYFCKGCHREMNGGPIDCHECHNHKKKKK